MPPVQVGIDRVDCKYASKLKVVKVETNANPTFPHRLFGRIGGGTNIAINILQCSISPMPYVRRRT